MLMGLQLGLFYGGRIFSGAWVFCGLERGNVVAFGAGKELPLLKGEFLGGGLGNSLL